MARKFTLDEEPHRAWEIWLNEDFCRDSYNINPDGNIAFYNEFAKIYQLLIAGSCFENSEKLKTRFESFKKPEKKIAMLVAHGYSDTHGWRYQDRSLKSVQDWIDCFDNKSYSCLVVGACNPGRREIYSKKVPIIYSKGILGYLSNYSTAIFDPESKLTEEFKRR